MTENTYKDIDEFVVYIVNEYENQLLEIISDKTVTPRELVGRGTVDIDIEFLSVVFALKKVLNLVKGTERLNNSTDNLNRLTKWLFGTTVLLFLAAITQIVLLCIQKWG